MALTGRTVLFFAGPLYEDLELWYPKIRLEEEGRPHRGRRHRREDLPGQARLSAHGRRQRGRDLVARRVRRARDPRRLRPRHHAPLEEAARSSPARSSRPDKPVAFICHAGWVPISAGIVRGRRGTSVGAIKDDLVNAGMLWEDSPVVVDGNLISSPHAGRPARSSCGR